ncbi:MAG: hypothetical protein R2862_02900 [Thermoanaerobaculia bacterium]
MVNGMTGGRIVRRQQTGWLLAGARALSGSAAAPLAAGRRPSPTRSTPDWMRDGRTSLARGDAGAA